MSGRRRKLKILLSAYACEPARGSEPYVGWSWARHLAGFAEVTVLTRANNRAAIRRGHPRGLRFLYFDPPAFLLGWKRRGLPVALFYLFWQLGARWFVRRQLPRFDLVQHLTFNSFKLPGFWWQHYPPTLLGPLGGGQTTSPCLLPLFGWQAPAEILRSFLVLLCRWNPLLWLSFRRAACIWTANLPTLRLAQQLGRTRTELVLETGIEKLCPLRRRKKKDTPLRLVWAGRMAPGKGACLAIRILHGLLARGSSWEVRLDMLGSGPDEAFLKNLAVQLGVAGQIDWHGWIPHDRMAAQLAQADIFLFTSARDTSGNVLLEAMAAGLPSVVICQHGAAEITTDQTSLRVVPQPLPQLVTALTAATARMTCSARLRKSMGTAARGRVASHYLWSAKLRRLRPRYAALGGGTPARA